MVFDFGYSPPPHHAGDSAWENTFRQKGKLRENRNRRGLASLVVVPRRNRHGNTPPDTTQPAPSSCWLARSLAPSFPVFSFAFPVRRLEASGAHWKCTVPEPVTGGADGDGDGGCG